MAQQLRQPLKLQIITHALHFARSIMSLSRPLQHVCRRRHTGHTDLTSFFKHLSSTTGLKLAFTSEPETSLSGLLAASCSSDSDRSREAA